jgi:hypothetical protein
MDIVCKQWCIKHVRLIHARLEAKHNAHINCRAYDDAETTDDERLSIFGCSEWPKPILGRRG